MKQFALFTLIVAMAASGLSQETDAKSAELPYKNKISLNLTPLLIPIRGTGNLSTPASLMYTRLGRKFNWRISANYNYLSVKPRGYFDMITAISDSMITSLRVIPNVHQANFRFGVEKVFQKNKFSFSFGGDIVLGTTISNSRSFNWNTFYTKDSSGTITYGQNSGYTGNYYSLRSNDYYLTTGLDLTFGVGFDLTKRFSLGLQYRPTLYYNIGLWSNQLLSDYASEIYSVKSSSSLHNNYLRFNPGACLLYLHFKL